MPPAVKTVRRALISTETLPSFMQANGKLRVHGNVLGLDSPLVLSL